MGLPGGVTLSGGQANADRGWVVPLWALEDLKIRVSSDTSGDLALVVALVDNNGLVLDERATTVHVQPATVAAPSRSEADSAPRQEAAITAAPPPQRPPAPALVAPPVLYAEAAAATRFAISVDHRPEDLPPGIYVRVKGLAGGVTLSGGQANADRGWVVPLWALDDLKIRVPRDMSGTLDLDIALVDNDGATLAERSVALRVKPRVAAVPSDLASPNKTVAAPAPAGATRRVLHAKGNDLPAGEFRPSALRPQIALGEAARHNI
jgi:hypothetical protein